MAPPPLARSTPPTRNRALSALDKPMAEAVNCLFMPASLHCKFVQVAVPLPAAAPMSNENVPSSDPDPELKEKVTSRLDGSPTVERLPNGSRDLATGWAANGEPV